MLLGVCSYLTRHEVANKYLKVKAMLNKSLQESVENICKIGEFLLDRIFSTGKYESSMNYLLIGEK